MSEVAFYDDFAAVLADPAYGRHEYERTRLRHLRRFLDKHDPQRVVEVGCGAGLFAPTIASRTRSYVACDLSHAMVHHALQRGGLAGCQLSAERLPLRDASVDLVVCSEVIEHVEAKRDAIGEWARIVRPGGHVWLTTPNPAFRTGWVDHLARAVTAIRSIGDERHDDGPGHEYHQDFDEWVELSTTVRYLEAADFNVLETRYLCPFVNPARAFARAPAAALRLFASAKTTQYYLVVAERRARVPSTRP